MIFTIRHAQETLELEIDKSQLNEAEDFFKKMDEDMAKGLRMGPEFVESPTLYQRSQIAAQHIVSALDTENYPLMQMMVGYILSRHENCTGLVLGDNGDPNDHQIVMG